MASRNFSRVQGLNKEIKTIVGRFTDAAKQKGLGWSVTNSATGQYTITLEDSYPHLLAATATVQAATGEDMNCIVISEDVDGSTPTVVIEVQTAGTASDLAGSEEVHFCLHLQNSSVPAV